MCFFLYVAFLPIKAVNSCFMSSSIHAMPWLPNMQDTNCWYLVDAHFHDGVTYLSCTVFDEKASITLYMNYCHKATLRLPKMQEQKSFMLHWGSISGWGREYVTSDCVSKGTECLIDGCLQPITTYIAPEARPKIIDTLLTFMFRIEQGACRICLCFLSRPILNL